MTSRDALKYNADAEWLNDIKQVFQFGSKTSPRGKPIYEIIGYTSRVSMDNPIIYNPDRKLGYKFMAAEAAWILNGRDDVVGIAPYAKHIKNFSDDGVKFFGAYGPKIEEQILYVTGLLARDPESRQAVINIWRENPGPSKDIPCTLSLQFLIRDNELHCVASMRSSDLWLGHPYDIFNFSCVSFAIMLYLNNFTKTEYTLGDLTLNAGSKHIYESDIDKVSNLITSAEDKPVTFERTPIFTNGRHPYHSDLVANLWKAADHEKGALSL